MMAMMLKDKYEQLRLKLDPKQNEAREVQLATNQANSDLEEQSRKNSYLSIGNVEDKEEIKSYVGANEQKENLVDT